MLWANGPKVVLLSGMTFRMILLILLKDLEGYIYVSLRNSYSSKCLGISKSEYRILTVWYVNIIKMFVQSRLFLPTPNSEKKEMKEKDLTSKKKWEGGRRRGVCVCFCVCVFCSRDDTEITIPKKNLFYFAVVWGSTWEFWSPPPILISSCSRSDKCILVWVPLLF